MTLMYSTFNPTCLDAYVARRTPAKEVRVSTPSPGPGSIDSAPASAVWYIHPNTIGNSTTTPQARFERRMSVGLSALSACAPANRSMM
jgi:hypothetical protein